MNPIALLRQFIQGLTSDTDPKQIGAGIALGFLIGLMPKATLTAQLLIVLMMATRVNIPMGLITVLAVSLLNPLFDRVTDPVGYALLTSEALRPLWTKLYNIPVVPWTGFNNTVVPGGLVLGAVLLAPVYLAGKRFGVFYNERFRDKVMNSRLVKGLKASWLFDWYFKAAV
ncbi:MAG: TIGR03546 family protein [Elusimicrobia bacterium]|nr:TIGR03546 family protein [Elusimicrobiota bacterium]